MILRDSDQFYTIQSSRYLFSQYWRIDKFDIPNYLCPYNIWKCENKFSAESPGGPLQIKTNPLGFTAQIYNHPRDH